MMSLLRKNLPPSPKLTEGLGGSAKAWLLGLALIFWALSPSLGQSPGDSLHRGRLALVSGVGGSFYLGGMLYLSEVWYRDHERVPFGFYRDLAGWQQMDKAAHAYIAYHQSRAGYQALRWSGLSRSSALWIGGSMGFVMQLPVEIFDGLYEGYGFSWSDVVANTAGSLLFVGQQLAWDEQRINFKFSFYPSSYAPLRPRVLGENYLENLFMDYNAQRYWLTFPLNRLLATERLPDWLHLAVGYGAGGMLSEFENPRFIAGQPAPELTRHRRFFLAPDLDWSAIAWRQPWLKGLAEGLNLLKFPSPALEYSRLYGWQFHLIFF